MGSNDEREREFTLIASAERFNPITYQIIFEFMMAYPGSEGRHFGYFDTTGGFRIYFSKPETIEYGEFLAWLKYLSSEGDIDEFFISPVEHDEWLAYGYFPGEDPSAKFYPKGYTDDIFIFHQSSRRNDDAKIVYVTNTLVKSTDANDRVFTGFKHYSFSTYVKMNMQDYVPERKSFTHISHWFFNHPDANLEMGFRTVTEKIRKLMIENVVKDKNSLITYIQSGPDKNKIDLTDPICIDSPELGVWLGYLGNDLTTTDIQTGVLLLNRVISYYFDQRGLQILVKHTETSHQSIEPVIKIWTATSVGQLLKHLFFYSRSHPDMPLDMAEADQEQDENRPRKRRRKNTTETERGIIDNEEEEKEPKRKRYNWFAIWQNHKSHLMITNCNFEPYALNNPPKVSLLHQRRFNLGNKELEYDNRMALNRFTGYTRDFAYCRNSYYSDHGKLCIKHFEELINQVFCGGNTLYSNYFHNWMAFIVQKPEQKTMVMTLIRSQMGMGKGFISKILQKWWDRHFYILTGQTAAQKFNSFLHNKKFLWVDEVSACIGDIGVLNSMISENTIAIEKKGVDQTNERNLVEFMGGTNNRINLPIGSDSRRWFIIEAPTLDREQLKAWKQKMATIYKQTLEDKTNGDLGAWALMFYYLKRDIKGFQPMLDLPRTEAIRKCIESSLHPVHAWWKYCLENKKIEDNQNRSSGLELYGYSWNSLFNIFRTDARFETVYGGRKTKLTQTEFMQELSKVVVINTDNSDKNLFYFRHWGEQIMRWQKTMPDVEIISTDNLHLETPPDVQIILRKIQETTTIPGLSELASVEKDYIITKLVNKIRELVPDKNVILNKSIVLRTVSSYPNKDIIEFS